MAQYVEATLDMADMTLSETSAHKELRVSQIRNGEANVKKITEAVSNFTNPFTLQNQEVSRSLLQAHEFGKDAMVTFF